MDKETCQGFHIMIEWLTEKGYLEESWELLNPATANWTKIEFRPQMGNLLVTTEQGHEQDVELFPEDLTGFLELHSMLVGIRN